MTQDQSEEVESLLEGWYHWARAQREFLGYGRVSPMFRSADAGDVHDDGDDVDARLNAVTSEMVDTCLSELTTMQRAAIDVHLRNKIVGVSIHRNPRLGTITEQHTAYQRAKDVLFPLLIRKGLVKRA